MSDLIKQARDVESDQRYCCNRTCMAAYLIGELADEIERLTDELAMEEECYEELEGDKKWIASAAEFRAMRARVDELEVVAGYVSAGEYDNARLELAATEETEW